jgi:RNA polymerase sigma-70 factor, ECF subfamily
VKFQVNQSTDRDLVNGCVSGNKRALETFVRRFSDPVYRMVQYTFKTRNTSYTKPDLQDLHNTVFLHFFEDRCKKLRQYKGKNGCSLHSWVRIVTVRLVIDHLRKEANNPLGWWKTNLPVETFAPLEKDSEPWVRMDRAAQEGLVRAGMKELMPRDRLFLKLHFMGDLSIREVADIMNISEANAHSLKHRAIKRLRTKVLPKLK